MQSRIKEWTDAEARGWSRFDNADFNGALAAWSDAVSLVEPSPDDARLIATSLQHVALAHAMMGGSIEAISFLEQALSIHFEARTPTLPEDHRFRAECLYRLGTLFADEYQFEHGIDCFIRAAELGERTGDTQMLVDCLMGWSTALDSIGDPLGAVNLMNRARLEARRLPAEHELRKRTENAVLDLLREMSEL